MLIVEQKTVRMSSGRDLRRAYQCGGVSQQDALPEGDCRSRLDYVTWWQQGRTFEAARSRSRGRPSPSRSTNSARPVEAVRYSSWPRAAATDPSAPDPANVAASEAGRGGSGPDGPYFLRQEKRSIYDYDLCGANRTLRKLRSTCYLIDGHRQSTEPRDIRSSDRTSENAQRSRTDGADLGSRIWRIPGSGHPETRSRGDRDEASGRFPRNCEKWLRPCVDGAEMRISGRWRWCLCAGRCGRLPNSTASKHSRPTLRARCSGRCMDPAASAGEGAHYTTEKNTQGDRQPLILDDLAVPEVSSETREYIPTAAGRDLRALNSRAARARRLHSISASCGCGNASSAYRDANGRGDEVLKAVYSGLARCWRTRSRRRTWTGSTVGSRSANYPKPSSTPGPVR